MIRINLEEGGQAREQTLTSAQAALLGASGAVRMDRGPRPGVWRVRAKDLIGSARFGSGADAVEIRIAPKIDIQRLMFLLGYGLHHGSWREPEVAAAEYPELLPAVAYAFVRAAERALRQGVLLGYRQTEAALTTVRGRIREGDQWRRWHGLPLPLEVRYDDYTVDIVENRLLLAAGVRLLRLPGVPIFVRKQLRRLRARLDGVSELLPDELPREGQPPCWRPDRRNARYHTALGLAELVLRGNSYEFEDGSMVTVDGLLLRMWQVFETFVTRSLSDALRPYGGRCGTQKAYHLDHGRRIRLIPDIVYYRRGDGAYDEPAAVVDAKYSVEGQGGHNPHIYQMLAYCTVLGLSRGHLVYAKGATPLTTHVLHGPHRIEIIQHALDLTRPPAEVLNQIRVLAERVAGV